MIKVGYTYPTVGGGKVKIVTRSGNTFTGDNGIWYDCVGYTERGTDLCLILATVSPAYPVKERLLTKNEHLLFQCLKETIEDLELRAQVHKTLTDEEMVVPMSDSRYRKAKGVEEKLEMVS